MIKLPRRRNAKTEQLKKLAARTRAARRLQTMPGVGPLTALAIEAFAPDMTTFKCGRDFAAWLGLVPRQHSSGGKERLGRVSREGQADIRQLLIVGAMSRANWLGRKSIPKGSWLAQILVRKPRMLVAIALANKSRQFHPRARPGCAPRSPRSRPLHRPWPAAWQSPRASSVPAKYTRTCQPSRHRSRRQFG
ncbi:transposase [Bradyrhizobium sp. USDA 4509]